MKIVLLDYGAGNIQSISFAIERLGLKADLSRDPGEIVAADKVIFPGVGQAAAAMEQLRQSGLDVLVPKLKQPVLGICLGMQLMCASSAEGPTKGLGIFDLEVQRFPGDLKVPQVGWNTLSGLRGGLFTGVPEGAHVYLVHSYYAPLSKDTLARTDYGLGYSAALGRDNFYGLQFHPEKSSGMGSTILENFLNLP